MDKPEQTKKPMLSFDDQVKWLNDNAFRIDKNEENDVLHFLKRKNYFYKLQSYIDCFEQQIKSFDMLVDISTIDMELRYVMLKLCLDIEHATKSYILRITTNDPKEDGYEIVKNVIETDDNPKKFKNDIFSNVTKFDTSDNKKHILEPYASHFDNPPIWIVLELSSFGKLRGFLKYLSTQKKNNSDLQYLERSFKYINILRNNCAHNNPLINNDIFIDEKALPHYIVTTLGSDGIWSEIYKRPLLLNTALALKAHKKLCSDSSHQHRIEDLNQWLERANQKKHLYSDCEIKKMIELMKKIVDIYV
ncbi:hypothetical protein SC12_10185 [Lactiplantibacillus plantarum]|nr:Abi family protein [Lactiplantibacillus plantarum]KIN19780.1 hypothetical protein SC12_10185 [Lactiplantibacillus plantarum]